jgi:hypothetical protein
MASTQNFVGNDVIASVPHNNLLTFDDHGAVDDASVMGSASTTPAQCLDLKHIYSVS